jgi:hypothetical protein
MKQAGDSAEELNRLKHEIAGLNKSLGDERAAHENS